MVCVMTRALALFLAALALLLPGGAVWAQSGARVVTTASWVEEWDPARQQWVRVEDEGAAPVPVTGAADHAAAFEPVTTTAQVGKLNVTQTVQAEQTRFITQPSRAGSVGKGAQFGPFRVLDERRAALVATTDAASPQAFAAMLAAYPGLEVIEFVDAPGTSHDLANLALGRAIRAAGLATHVPDGGSARSGAVELFLAGTRRTVAPRALFAVHSWRDELGREPADFAEDAPENRLYLDYYAEMGMGDDTARAFYAMTNSVPHAGALWLQGADMARWIAPDRPVERTPAMRALAPAVDPLLEAPLRMALARSGRALVEAAQLSWARPLLRPHDEVAAPWLAYADLGMGVPAGFDWPLLDSRLAFP